MPPSIPRNFTQAQKEEFIIAYRLRSLDVGLQNYMIRTTSFSGISDEVLRFYQDLKHRILSAKASPLLLPGVKRKLSDDDQASVPSPDTKRANTNGPGLQSGLRSKKPNIFAQSEVQRSTPIPKPNNPSIQSSQTSKIFAHIAKDGPKTPFTLKSLSSGSSTAPNPSISFTTTSGPVSDNGPRSTTSIATGSNALRTGVPASSTRIETGSDTNSNGVPASNAISFTGSDAIPTGVPASSAGLESKLKPTFKVPSFGPVSGSSFINQFGKKAEDDQKKEKMKRKAEEFDSEEEDEAEWEKTDEERQRLKRQKISEQLSEITKEATPVPDPASSASLDSLPNSTFKVPSFGPTSGPSFMSQFGKKAEDEKQKEKAKRKAEEYDSDEDDEAESQKKDEGEQRLKRQRIDQLPGTVRETTSVFDPAKSTSTSAFTQAEGGSAEKVRSLWDRIEHDENGEPKRATSPKSSPVSNPFMTGQPKPFDFDFGKPSGKSSTSTLSSQFGNPAGSASLFGSRPLSTPTLTSSIGQSAGNPPQSFGGLFGASKHTATDTVLKPAANPANSPGFRFGTPAKPADESVESAVADSVLKLAANPASSSSFRFNPPTNSTDGDVGNDHEVSSAIGSSQTDSQINVNNSAPEFKEEDILFEVRAKATEHDSGSEKWVVKAVGQLYVLKHRVTNKIRVIIRVPNGNVMLNMALMASVTYEHIKGAKAVRFFAPTSEGTLRLSLFRVKSDEDAAKLAAILEDSKS